MRNFTIDLIWTKVQIAITAIGGWLGYFVGGMDGLLIALIVLMSLDYISGVMCAVIDKRLSSAIGFRGICKKVLILMLVGVANIVDIHVVGTGSALRGATVCFYLSNEGLSILENASVAILSFQSEKDPMVPYDYGYPMGKTGRLISDPMYGTHAIYEKALEIGLRAEHHPCPEARHRLHLDDEMKETPRFYEIRDAMVNFFAEQME